MAFLDQKGYTIFNFQYCFHYIFSHNILNILIPNSPFWSCLKKSDLKMRIQKYIISIFTYYLWLHLNLHRKDQMDVASKFLHTHSQIMSNVQKNKGFHTNISLLHNFHFAYSNDSSSEKHLHPHTRLHCTPEILSQASSSDTPLALTNSLLCPFPRCAG